MTKREIIEELKRQIRERIDELESSLKKEPVPAKGDLGDIANELHTEQDTRYIIGIYKRDLAVLSQIPDARKETVEAGSLVKLKINGEEIIRLFAPLQNVYEAGEVKTASTNSPLFREIKGAKEGVVVKYQIDGREFVVKILEIQ